MIPLLGVNIDHVATLRKARGTAYPDPVPAAAMAERAGADQITCHLRGDRRHINERDLEILARTVQTRLNVEIAATDEMLTIVERIRPHMVTLVPERPGEVTTEGGLDVVTGESRREVEVALKRLADAGIRSAIFADPQPDQVAACAGLSAGTIELNTAAFAEAGHDDQAAEVERIRFAAKAARKAGLFVAAGHGLHFHNVGALVDLELIAEYNIGHAIIARAVFCGLDEAVRDMKALLQ